MKRTFIIIVISVISVAFAGCGIYNKYTSQSGVSSNLYGTTEDVIAAQADNSIAEMSWREFFTDPLLQNLIDSVLARNTDFNSARIAVEQAQASLKATKLGYLPSVTFAPSGSVSSFNFSPAGWTYNLPLQMDWNLDFFAVNTNQKRKAQAVLAQAETRKQVVQANLISAVAQQYCMLQLLDRQLEILLATDSLWKSSLEMQRALWENGKSYSTAVDQMESSYLNVKTQIVDVKRSIRSVENAICQLLAISPQHISRSRWSNYELPQRVSTGVPAQLLTYRPDIKMADHLLEEAFYNTQAARAAFYPKVSLQGIIGWTNNGGSVTVNPGAMLLNAVLSLMQPVFAQGKLRANLKISKLSQEDIAQQYVQTVINAGNQVNEALADCQAAREKDVYYKRQIEVLQSAYTGTHELMDNGKASYLEVLTAQEGLLGAQISEATNLYNGARSIIALYIALGGGAK
ncbi:MAG: TolC family protein [Bacteroidales bacterium]|nr:TolC family protein [Bacteroidales bacterium]